MLTAYFVKQYVVLKLSSVKTIHFFYNANNCPVYNFWYNDEHCIMIGKWSSILHQLMWLALSMRKEIILMRSHYSLRSKLHFHCSITLSFSKVKQQGVSLKIEKDRKINLEYTSEFFGVLLYPFSTIFNNFYFPILFLEEMKLELCTKIKRARSK